MTPAIEQVLPLDTRAPANSLRVIYRIEPWIAALALIVLAPAMLVVAAIIDRNQPARHVEIGDASLENKRAAGPRKQVALA